MEDILGNKLVPGDLVVTCAGYNGNGKRLRLGIVRKYTNHLHLYALDRWGLSCAKKDKGDKTQGYCSPWFTYSGYTCMKISEDYLKEDNLKYYKQIKQVLGHVTTTDNT